MPSPEKFYAARDDWRSLHGRSDAFEMRGVAIIVKCEGRRGWRVSPFHDHVPTFIVDGTLDAAKHEAETRVCGLPKSA